MFLSPAPASNLSKLTVHETKLRCNTSFALSLVSLAFLAFLILLIIICPRCAVG